MVLISFQSALFNAIGVPRLKGVTSLNYPKGVSVCSVPMMFLNMLFSFGIVLLLCSNNMECHLHDLLQAKMFIVEILMSKIYVLLVYELLSYVEIYYSITLSF